MNNGPDAPRLPRIQTGRIHPGRESFDKRREASRSRRGAGGKPGLGCPGWPEPEIPPVMASTYQPFLLRYISSGLMSCGSVMRAAAPSAWRERKKQDL